MVERDFTEAHARLDDLIGLKRDLSIAALRRYYAEPDGYDGRLFDGYEPSDPYEITGSDVASLIFLSMEGTLRPLAVATTDREFQVETQELLRQIPPNVPLHEAPYDVIGPNSAASKLWYKIAGIAGGNRETTAYKICARKRPDLLPISDSEVRLYLGQRNAWDCMWQWFQSRSHAAEGVAELREAANVGHIGLLRALDVPMWMINSGRVGQV